MHIKRADILHTTRRTRLPAACGQTGSAKMRGALVLVPPCLRPGLYGACIGPRACTCSCGASQGFDTQHRGGAIGASGRAVHSAAPSWALAASRLAPLSPFAPRSFRATPSARALRPRDGLLAEPPPGHPKSGCSCSCLRPERKRPGSLLMQSVLHTPSSPTSPSHQTPRGGGRPRAH
jgi:hypothetical protein